MDPEYVELSSDEDVGLDEKLGFDDSGEEDCDWIQELLKEVDRQTDTEDSNESDDVVLVSEVVVSESPKLKLKNCDVGLKELDEEEEDDDDCVVLDGDPDKPEAVENNQMVDESDELQVVAETGQVACRDYPHPRHLCVKYPFASTGHEQYCNQCHCYVCDSLAPCLHWDENHCHATDKEEFWKNERKSLKNRHQAAISVPQFFTSLSAEMIQISQGAVSVPFEPTYVPPNQVPGPATIRACSRSSSFVPGFDHSGQVVPRNRFRPNLVLQHLRSTGNDIQRDRRHTAANAGLQVKSPPSVFKRTGPGSPLLSNRRYCFSNQTFRGPYMRIPPPMPMPIPPVHNNSMRWQPLHAQMGSEFNTYQLPSQPNIHANFSNSLPFQPQLTSTPNVMNNHLNSLPFQPMMSPLSNTADGFGSSVTSQPQVPSQAQYYGNTFLRPTQSQLSFQPVVDNSYANATPLEPMINSQPDFAPNEYQNVEHVDHHGSFLDSTFEDIDLGSVNLTSDTNQEPPSQHQDVGLVTENVTLPHTELDNLFVGSPNVDALNFQYDNWSLGSSDKPVHSPEPDISDSSFFFGL
ncbi:COPII coat assembly protein SEC16-like [Heracleum sosnowskyi]|uniref:COPII coat assembly protein SEC16-like n=1 Tax=Heracleum sosnowskyi TaxID=360622 RepID=A0AAD8LYV5_9APIA|nr:COPII coat assembly protein SEC16-like [Heracleum sosnowskyi]